jgi:two-component system, NtrC family, sensor kinase
LREKGPSSAVVIPVQPAYNKASIASGGPNDPMRASIQAKLVIGFTIALLILGAMSLLSYYNANSVIEANHDESETRERLSELASTLAAMRAAESYQRAYVLTNSNEYARAFDKAVADLPGHFHRLRLLFASRAGALGRVTRLAKDAEDRIVEMRQVVESRVENQRGAARARIGSETDGRLMQRIERDVLDISNTERERLVDQTARANRGARRVPLIHMGLVLMECLLLALGYYLVAHDVAHRKKTEDALRESELFYHSLVETLPQNIFRKDALGRFTFANRRFCATVGRPLEEIADHTDLDLFPAPLAEKYRQDDARVISTGEVFETVEEHVTPDGQKHYVQVIKTPLYDHDESVIGTQGIFWDVTERRRAEDRLRDQNEQLQAMALSERLAHEERKEAQSRMVETAKLAGLGQMVAGVAHEINNPLSFVSNNVAVLQRDLSELRDLIVMYRSADPLLAQAQPELASRIRNFVDEIDLEYTLSNLDGLLNRTRDGLMRIQQIVKDLRLFARLDASDLNEVDLNAGVESTLNIIAGHAKKKNVTIHLERGDLPSLLCYPAKINQVIMNLVGNAIDASPEFGTVRVRTRTEGEMLLVDVIDQGPGISPEIRDRIFEPFFTTKPVGIGTGLGLSISYGIVQDHGGSIEVQLEPEAGTRFTVRLPRHMTLKGAASRAPGVKTAESIA